MLFLLSATVLFAEIDVPESGRIRVDGRLNDWRRPEWIPIQSVMAGSPTNISNAVWTMSWDEDGTIYVAVQYEDADVVLRNGTNQFDCIELYARGDLTSKPLNFYKTQTSAQSYLFGLQADESTKWLQMGPFKELPEHNPVQAAVTIDGPHFVYEAAILLYDDFDPHDKNDCSESELFSEREIGFDIAIIDIGHNSPGGILGHNGRKKRSGADQIAVHLLED